MINTQASGATAQPITLPHVYSLKTVKKALLKEPVRYHARPLFQGVNVTVNVTATHLDISPAGHDVFVNNGMGFDRDEFLGCRKYLKIYDCDTIRFDARALPLEGKADPLTDFFRMSLLRNGRVLCHKLVQPEFPDGRNADLHRYYVEIQKNDAAQQLDWAKGLSSTFPRKLGPPFKGVTAPVDGVLWASEQTWEAPAFIVLLRKVQSNS